MSTAGQITIGLAVDLSSYLAFIFKESVGGEVGGGKGENPLSVVVSLTINVMNVEIS